MVLAPSKTSQPTACAAAMSEVPSHTGEVAPVWSHLPGGLVDGGEIIMLAIKPSMWRPFFDSIGWLVACSLTAMVVTWLRSPFPGLSVTVTAQLILMIGLVQLGVAVARWISTWYVLTNRRVINIGGVRAPRISSCLLVDVRNTYLHVSAPERLAALGTITFASDDPHEAPRLWRSIAEPELVHGKIRRAIETALDHFHPG